ncbi:FAD-dependent oxidoreductase [Vagococcus sp.]|uniref:FAD-dependent oxidoreductase n=1 Tax=Vagococcus sp. TaxID=1933889 RepID=UPI002FCBC32A
MKIIIIGSVAAGTSVAAKARRNNEDVEIMVFDQDKDISYSICGIPYYIGREVENVEKLTPRNAEWFKKRYNVDIFTEHKVVKIDHENKQVHVTNLQTEETRIESYDALVLATGATPTTPDVFRDLGQVDNLFQVRNIQNAKNIHNYIEGNVPKTATIIGGGFIGLEMAEQLTRRGIEVTLLQRSSQVMKHMDQDMAFRIQKELETNHVDVHLNTVVTNVRTSDGAIVSLETTGGGNIVTDMVILATGVVPNTGLVDNLPIQVGESGAISVNKKLQTSVPDIYAVGDVAESYSLITGKPIYRPLGSTANKMGRTVGDILTSGTLEHRGILGTGIVRVFDLDIAYTGLTETEALAEGYEIETLYSIKPNNADYLGGKELTIKAIADKQTSKILGAQIIGPQGADKRIDVIATAISFGAVAEDLFHLDLAYAPPFATTKDPVIYTGMALDNAINKNRPLMTPHELITLQAKGVQLQIIDTRSPKQFNVSNIPGAINIPLADLREKLKTLNQTLPTITYCNKGVTGNAAQNILINAGFEKVYNLSGGNKNYQIVFELNNRS